MTERERRLMSEIGRHKFNLSRKWHCTESKENKSGIKYVMQKMNNNGIFQEKARIRGFIELM